MVAVVAVGASAMSGGDSPDPDVKPPVIPDEPDVPDVPDTPDGPDAPVVPDEPDEPVTPPEDLPTLGESNALKQAKSYIRYDSFSYTELIEQLKFEGYSDGEAKYGADHCGADWNAEAVECAQSYMSWSSMSRAELYEQLLFEGFTASQADHGLEAVGS